MEFESLRCHGLLPSCALLECTAKISEVTLKLGGGDAKQRPTRRNAPRRLTTDFSAHLRSIRMFTIIRDHRMICTFQHGTPLAKLLQPL